MKLLIFTDAHGNFDLVNETMEKHPDVMIAVSLGNLGLYSKSTPLNKFLFSSFRHEAEASILWNEEKRSFDKLLYTLYGSIDDPFIPPDEQGITNLIHVDNGVIPFLARESISPSMTAEEINNAKSETRHIGFLNGYYSKTYYKYINLHRLHKERKKKSNALCGKDFSELSDKKIDVLLSHEAPALMFDKSQKQFGSRMLEKLIERTNPGMVMCGHHKTFKHSTIGESVIIMLPQLTEGYAVLDLYKMEMEYHEQKAPVA